MVNHLLLLKTLFHFWKNCANFCMI